MIRHNSQPLAPLPFGNDSALTFDSVSSCTSFLAKLPDRPSVFDALGNATAFRVRLHSVAAPSLTLVAGSSTPKLVQHVSPRVTLVIPFGECGSIVRIGRTTHRWASPNDAFVISAGEVVAAESTNGSFLRLDVEEQSLIKTAATMAGGPQEGSHRLDVGRSRVVSLRSATTNWHSHFRGMCSSIDGLRCDAGAIVDAGLDDAILRAIVFMLWPGLATPQGPHAKGDRGFDLDPLLERITSCLGDRITLTDMEQWSGRSCRAIQLAFKRRFGVSPMQWLRDRRLDAIHARLSLPSETRPVHEIARECGIHRMATLASEYMRRFGTTPGALKRRRSDLR